MQKAISLSVLLSLLVGAVGAQTALADTPPYDPPIKSEITIKWGNVVGTPVHTNKTSFDGKLSISDGNVELIRTIAFEDHADGKDEITNKANPVSWDSWIYGLHDGVRVEVTADPSETLYIETDHGGLSVKYATLLTADSRTILKFGDGREIIVKVREVETDPFYVYALWGGPVALPEAETDEALDARVASLNDISRDVSVQAALDEVAAISILPLSPLVDFHGKLGVGAGAHMDFIEPILFESFHGDEIVSEGENTVEWNSFINGHFDGVFNKVQLDQNHPIDDQIGVKFGGDVDWSKRYSLASLYVQGVLWDRVEVDGTTYLFALVATDEPICSIHGPNSTVCPSPVPLPLPIDIEPVPVEPVRIEKPIEDVVLKKTPRIVDSILGRL